MTVDEALAFVDAVPKSAATYDLLCADVLAAELRRERARLDFIEKHALFLALDGRKFSVCSMGPSRSCIDAAIEAVTPNDQAQARAGRSDEGAKA